MKTNQNDDDPIIWRIDDRLIHGQVIIGWCSQLPVQEIIVCDNEISRNEWEKNLLLMASPPDIPARALSETQTAEFVQNAQNLKPYIMVLMKSPEVVKHLLDLGVDIRTVNVGGIHFQENRREFLPYLYLSDREIELFEELMERGVTFECRDLPNAPSYNLAKIIKRKK